MSVQEMQQEDIEKTKKRIEEEKEAQKKAIEEAEKARKAAFDEQMSQMAEIDKEIFESEMQQKSTAMQVAFQKGKVVEEERKLRDLTFGTAEYTKQYKVHKQEVLKLQNLEKKNAEEIKKATEDIAKEAKKAADERKKELQDRQKSLEAELKGKEQQLERMAQSREEFELRLKIEKLENGDEAQKAQAEAIKNGLKRNELMKKYGYSLEEANEKMREMLKLEEDKNNKGKDGKGKFEYSEEDVERAKRVLERGEGGTVGKKTLEQAQKIVNGEDIGETELSGFIGAKKRAKKVEPKEAEIASNAEIEAVNPKKSQSQNGAESKLPKSMEELSKEIKNLSKEINDLKNVTRDSANKAKDN